MSSPFSVFTVARTLHTYCTTIKILCHAFTVEHAGSSFTCEKRLIQEAYNLNNHGKNIILIIDDAHLMEMHTLRKLRLIFEDFPKNHNIVLVGQTPLLHNLALKVNEDIKGRVTYSSSISSSPEGTSCVSALNHHTTKGGSKWTSWSKKLSMKRKWMP